MLIFDQQKLLVHFIFCNKNTQPCHLNMLELRAKYGGMEASDVRRPKELEAEHGRLKQMFAALSQENQALKDVIAKML